MDKNHMSLAQKIAKGAKKMFKLSIRVFAAFAPFCSILVSAGVNYRRIATHRSPEFVAIRISDCKFEFQL